MIRPCNFNDTDQIFEIINDASIAYKGVIPADCWHEPYMSVSDLKNEILSGVKFYGYEQNGMLIGVMGIQDVKDVTLIRHAYVRTTSRNQGLGDKLMSHLKTLTKRPILIGTWEAATWAIRFYEKRGFRLASPAEKAKLLKKYWSISDRQVETSVVLLEAN
jgi:GNAT superfamily N-acetyltransferase